MISPCISLFVKRKIYGKIAALFWTFKVNLVDFPILLSEVFRDIDVIKKPSSIVNSTTSRKLRYLFSRDQPGSNMRQHKSTISHTMMSDKSI